MRMLPSSSHLPPRQKREPQRGKLARCVLVATALFVAQILCLDKAASQVTETTNHYRQWAFIQLNNLDEFHCLDYLYYRESRWNPSARNGSHYGIPQMRNVKLKTMDAMTQIDWGLRYIKGRYQTPCKAWAFFKANGWH